MGYFSNGSEGIEYENKYCVKCVHYALCPVWSIHFIFNYDQFKNKDLGRILDELIPRKYIENEKCKMFYPTHPTQEVK